MAQGNLLQLTVKRLYVVIRRTEAWLIILEHRYTLTCVWGTEGRPVSEDQ
jgi:hypothetical protein